MKNYSLSYEGEKRFIKYFKPTKKGKLSVNMATGEQMMYADTISNRKALLENMKEQVQKASADVSVADSYESVLLKAKKVANSAIYATAAGFCASEILRETILNSTQTQVFGNSIFTFTGLLCYAAIVRRMYLQFKTDDLIKNKLFLENEELINENANETFLSNFSRKIRRVAKKNAVEGRPFDINNIHYLSLQELKDIINDIKISQQLGLSNEEDGPTLDLKK